MSQRFWHIAVIWTLVLVTAWLGEWFYRTYVFTADEPRPVAFEGQLSDWEKTNIELFRTAAPSVAYITTQQLRFNPYVGLVGAQGARSGFVWDKAGHVVTNYHVIEGATIVYVQLDAGDPIRARVVGGAQEYDIAVVMLSDPPATLTPIPLGISKMLQVGQRAFAIGNPYGLSRTLTTGIVSALERHLPTAEGREVRGVIQPMPRSIRTIRATRCWTVP